jgi:hypothetical protein
VRSGITKERRSIKTNWKNLQTPITIALGDFTNTNAHVLGRGGGEDILVTMKAKWSELTVDLLLSLVELLVQRTKITLCRM